MHKKLLMCVLCLILNLSVFHLSALSGQFDPNANPDLALGSGFDTLANATRGDCVRRSPPKSEGLQGEDTLYSLLQIEDSATLRKALNLSASASLNAAASGSGKLSLASSIDINDYSLYLMASVRVSHATDVMRDVELTPEARQLLENDDIERFREKCGDEFIVGWKTGGEFYAMIQIDTHSKEQRESLASELKGSYGVFSASAEFSQKFESISSSNRLQIYMYRSGGDPQALAISPDEMLLAAIHFPLSVADDKAKRIAAVGRSYKTLTLPHGKSTADVNKQQSVLSELARYQDALERLQANIIYINSNSSQFEKYDAEMLGETSQRVRDGLNIIRENYAECHNQYTKCKLSTEANVLVNADLPERVYSAIDACPLDQRVYIEKRDPGCGVASYKSGTGPACGVASYHVGRNPCCGVEKYNSKRDEVCGAEVFERAVHRDCGIRSSQDMCFGLSVIPATPRDRKLQVCRDNYKGNDIDEESGCNCLKFNDCETEANGVRLWKSCQREEFGVASYRECSCADLGVKEYNTCEHESFGIKEYRKCRLQSFGFERCRA